MRVVDERDDRDDRSPGHISAPVTVITHITMRYRFNLLTDWITGVGVMPGSSTQEEQTRGQESVGTGYSDPCPCQCSGT